MNFGAETYQKTRLGAVQAMLAVMLLAVALMGAFGNEAFAQEAASVNSAPASVTVDNVAVADSEQAAETATVSGYTPMGPDQIKGQPTAGAIGFQDQYTKNGEYALSMHNAILMPVITFISLFVLGLLLWVVARYRKKRNPVPSRTTHNTLIEVLWTLIPVLVLVVIAIPSITLLARQYESPPEDAVTIKATGYQWYWGYSYPDNGDFEIISNMLSQEDAKAAGLPGQLAVDNRMVVPANTPLRIQTTGADVIHGFGIPSLWFKIDAVPGRLNERLLEIEEPGIYYGQCVELCGPRHGYMPIAIEALPRAEWEAWVLEQAGGTLGGEEEVAAGEPDAEVLVDEVPEATEVTEETAPAA